MKKLMLVLVSVATCGMAFAFTTDKVPEKTYATTLTLDVASDTDIASAVSAAGASIADITGNAYARIVKTGAGRLTVDQSLAGFSGDIFVEGGTYCVTVDGAFGDDAYTTAGGSPSSDAGFVVVRNEASIVWKSENKYQFSFLKKVIYAAGTGVNGTGALAYEGGDPADQNGATTGKSIWAQHLVLTGDTLIANKTSKQASFGMSRQATQLKLYMNGHRLSVDGKNGVDFPFVPYVDIAAPGSIEVICGTLYAVNVTTSSYFYLPGDASHQLIVDEGARFKTGLSAYTTTDWTLKLCGTDALSFPSGTSTFVWSGSVELAADVEVPVNAGSTLVFGGPISGPGSLSLGDNAATCEFKSANTFTGSFGAANKKLIFDCDGGIPTTSRAVAFTNATVVLTAPAYTIPDVTLDGPCTVSNAASVCTGRLIKTGDGELKMDRNSFSSLDIRGGSLRLQPMNDIVVPGLFGGYRLCSAKTGTDGYQTAYNNNESYTNGAPVLTPVMAQSSVKLAASNTNIVYSYSGYLVNPETEAKTWTFSIKTSAKGKLYINGVKVAENASGQRGVGQALMQPGNNAFYFIDYRDNATVTGCESASAANCSTNPTIDGKNKWDDATTEAFKKTNGRAGLLIDRQGRTPYEGDLCDPKNWEIPADPGDGSVFRVATNLAQAVALGLYEVPVSEELSAVKGASLELAGNPTEVKELSGIPEVTNEDAIMGDLGFKIVESWSVSGADLAAAGCFTSDRSVTFAAGAKLVIDTDGLKSHRRYELMSADGGITGLPELELTGKFAGLKGSLELSSDGKTLSFVSPGRGLILFVK